MATLYRLDNSYHGISNYISPWQQLPWQLYLTLTTEVLTSFILFSMILKSRSIPILTPTQGTDRPLGANMPTRLSYRPPPATEPTLSCGLSDERGEGCEGTKNSYKGVCSHRIFKIILTKPSKSFHGYLITTQQHRTLDMRKVIITNKSKW